MAQKRMIDTKFWSDNFIVDLEPSDRYVFLYLLTNEHTNICGIYELSLKVIERETGTGSDSLLQALKSFDNKIYYIDGWVFVKNFIKHQSMNESVKTGIGRSISEVPKDILAKLREKDEEYYSLCTSCIQAVTGSDTLGTGSGLLNLTKPKPNLTKLNQTKTKPNQTKPNSNIAEKSASDDSGVVGGIVGEGTDIEVIPDLTQDPKNKHVRRIGLFARFLNVKFTSKDHQASFIKRNLRSARLLDPYTDERILEVLIWLHNNADFKVTMETVGKYIDDDLEKLSINNTNNIPTL